MSNSLPRQRNPGAAALKWLAWLTGALLLIITLVWFFIDPGSPNFAISVFLISSASAFSGGFLGFLFGIPKGLQRQSGFVQQDTSPPSGTGRSYEQNTNLERISEWLTTMIIGITLTQVPGLISRFQALSTTAAQSMNASSITAGSLMIVFFVCGFLMFYLWTRSNLSITDAIRDKTLDEIGKLHSREDYQSQKQATTLPAIDLADSADKWERTPGTAPDDPWKGRFGGKSESNNLRLDAEVTPIEGSVIEGKTFYQVAITVRSTDPKNPLQGQVRLFLHDSFAPYDKLFVQVDADGVARYTIRSYGAFTIGALAHGGDTQLELDMAEDPRFPNKFRAE